MKSPSNPTAQTIRRSNWARQPPSSRRLWGTVTDIIISPPSVTVQIGTSAKSIPLVRHGRSYRPILGDKVFIGYMGTDMVVEDALANGPETSPRGTLGYAQVTANQAGIGTGATDITGLSVGPLTIPPGGRRLKITTSVLFSGLSAGQYMWLFLMMDGAEISEMLITAPGGYLPMSVTSVTQGLGLGPHTFKVQAKVSSGTVSTTATAVLPAFLLVEDVGAA